MVFFENTNGINVGVGISDITGPAAEVGMVSFFVNMVNWKVSKLW